MSLQMKKECFNRAEFDAIKFVAKAISKDQTRPQLHGVFVTENLELVATDGSRLHILEFQENPYLVKFFESHKNKNLIFMANKAREFVLVENPSQDFPNWQKLKHNIDDAGKKHTYFLRSIGENSSSEAILSISQNLKAFFNIVYMQDIFDCEVINDFFDYQQLEEMSPIVMKFKSAFNMNFRAVIMPFRA